MNIPCDRKRLFTYVSSSIYMDAHIGQTVALIQGLVRAHENCNYGHYCAQERSSHGDLEVVLVVLAHPFTQNSPEEASLVCPFSEFQRALIFVARGIGLDGFQQHLH